MTNWMMRTSTTNLKTKFRMRFVIFFLFCNSAVFAHNAQLQELEKQIHRDFFYLNEPADEWLLNSESEDVLDVAIVGGGMAGMTAAFALQREGIQKICLFDQNEAGREGPWVTCARMNYLRSGKAVLGPACGFSNLTFRTWFEKTYCQEEWDTLNEIPTHIWHEYLCWYRKVLGLQVSNEVKLKKIRPSTGHLVLEFESSSIVTFVKAKKVIKTRKVILATGREGSGGQLIPSFMEGVSKRFFAHTGECFCCNTFYEKDVVIIGAGASAFDAAAVAIESGAKKVQMLLRRHSLPLVNKFSHFNFPGIAHGFFALKDKSRCDLLKVALQAGIPPPKASYERVSRSKNFTIHYQVDVHKVEEKDDKVILHTSQGDFSADFIVLGTGYEVDPSKREELIDFKDLILFWKDRLCPEMEKDFFIKHSEMAFFPFLGPHFQYIEKEKGSAPFLKDIYCFNYGAFLSHGVISGDISSIGIGAARLARGVASDFFGEDLTLYQEMIETYDYQLFNPCLTPTCNHENH